MWSKLKDRLKKNELEKVPENQECKNCGTEFKGHFCPNCGQAVNDFDKPFGFIFYNFLGDFFAFDARFFRTLSALIIRPGFLSKEYFEGRRVRYAPPLRIFIFMSFILFLLLQNYTQRGLTRVLESDSSVFEQASGQVIDSMLAQLNNKADSSAIQLSINQMAGEKTSSDTSANDRVDFQLNLETFRDASGLRERLNLLAVSLEKQLETESDPAARMKLREYIGLCRSPENAIAKVLQYISWAFFLLLPIFALILKLVYLRRKQRYMKHLIFSIHIHSFIFLILTLIVALYLAFDFNLGFINSVLIFSLPVYIIIAMKKFYGQSFAKLLAKFLSVSILYNLVFWTVIVIAVLNALGLV